MKRAGIMLLRVLVTAVGLWYVFHDPQRRAQIADALRHASISWVILGWVCYSVVEILATVRWQILLRFQGIHPSWLQVGGIVMIGLFFNQFLPGGIGGDAMRPYLIFRLASVPLFRNLRGHVQAVTQVLTSLRLFSLDKADVTAAFEACDFNFR
jgi:uncharacterized protein (TIRG00374 family)